MDNGDGTFTVNNQAAFDSASTILDNVTGDPATVTAAKDETTAFIAGGTVPDDTFTLAEALDPATTLTTPYSIDPESDPVSATDVSVADAASGTVL